MTRRARSTFRARYVETDQMGIIHHSAYLAWCEIGRTDYIRDLGTSYAELERRGIYLAVADVNIRYGAAARYDDLIEVESRLDSMKSRTLGFAYQISRLEPDPGPLARASTTLVSIDDDGRPRRLPAEVVDLFRDT